MMYVMELWNGDELLKGSGNFFLLRDRGKVTGYYDRSVTPHLKYPLDFAFSFTYKSNVR